MVVVPLVDDEPISCDGSSMSAGGEAPAPLQTANSSAVCGAAANNNNNLSHHQLALVQQELAATSDSVGESNSSRSSWHPYDQQLQLNQSTSRPGSPVAAVNTAALSFSASLAASEAAAAAAAAIDIDTYFRGSNGFFPQMQNSYQPHGNYAYAYLFSRLGCDAEKESPQCRAFFFLDCMYLVTNRTLFHKAGRLVTLKVDLTGFEAMNEVYLKVENLIKSCPLWNVWHKSWEIRLQSQMKQ